MKFEKSDKLSKIEVNINPDIVDLLNSNMIIEKAEKVPEIAVEFYSKTYFEYGIQELQENLYVEKHRQIIYKESINLEGTKLSAYKFANGGGEKYLIDYPGIILDEFITIKEERTCD